MEIDGVRLFSYVELLEVIAGKENHLLLGNGFNRGLGVDTSYRSIFMKMIGSKYSVYSDVAQLAESCQYDLELFIGELEKDIAAENIFLRKYLSNKVKMDFMQATHEIVKAEIKNVYAEQNEGIYLLLKQFSNYFTLNFDPFLYLLLLHFKAPEYEETRAVALQATIKFTQDDLNFQHNQIYDEIKRIRNGSLTIYPDEIINPTNASIDKVTKATFTAIIKQYAKSNFKNWSGKDIGRVVDLILEEEKKNQVLENIDDGAQLALFGDNLEFVFDVDRETQNLFFLHGAFHIYKDGKSIKKITQQTDRALYDRLESILNDEEQEIVCVFQSENKLGAIGENAYLSKCYDSIGKLSGNLVILGCALSDNDAHIFDQINASEIMNIYISTINFTEDTVARAKQIFPDKSIECIDVGSISYTMPEV